MKEFFLSQFRYFWRDGLERPLSKPHKPQHSRICRVEALENREMLSVSVAEFAALRDVYEHLDLSANIADYNIIEIKSGQISVQSIQEALALAGQTRKDDLIVIRTDRSNNTLTLQANPITIDIDSARFGSVAIVSLSASHTLLTVDTQNLSRAFRINNGDVALGGMEIVGQTWSFDAGRDYDGLVSVRGQSVLQTSQFITTSLAPSPQESFEPPTLPVGLSGESLSWEHYQDSLVQSGIWKDNISMPAGEPPAEAHHRENSEYMIGSVWVTLALFENPEHTWANLPGINHIENTISHTREGLDWWEDMFDIHNPNSVISLTFHLDTFWADTPFSTTHPLVSNGSEIEDTEGLWGKDFYEANGVTGQWYLYIAMDFNNRQRIANNTDWAFTIFVTNRTHTLGSGQGQGNSYIGGPRVLIEYNAQNSFRTDNMRVTVAHEVAHVFYALDEYSGSSNHTERSGYYNTQNTNHPSGGNVHTANSIMSNGYVTGFRDKIASPETLEMIGWRDSNGNGIIDILDTPLTLSVVSYKFNIFDKTFSFTGNSSVTALQNQNPNRPPGGEDWQPAPSSITLNTVDRLQYRFDTMPEGEWITLPQFYGGSQHEVNTTTDVADGSTTITFRTICERTGVVSNEQTFNCEITDLPEALPIEAVAESPTTIRVSWRSIESAAGYVVQYTTSPVFAGMPVIRTPYTTPTGGTLFAKADEDEILIPNLTAGTNYYVRLAAVGQDGNYSDWIIWSGNEEEHSTPLHVQTNHSDLADNLTVRVEQDVSSSLKITLPTEANRIGIDYYVIRYANTSTGPSSGIFQEVRYAGSVPFVFLTGLASSAAYTITVEAVGKPGYGNQMLTVTGTDSHGNITTGAHNDEITAARKVSLRLANGGTNTTIRPANAGNAPTIESVTLTWEHNSTHLTRNHNGNKAYTVTVQQNWNIPASVIDGNSVQERRNNLQFHLDNPENLIWHTNVHGHIVGVTILGLNSGISYRFAVQAFDVNGNPAKNNGNNDTPANLTVRTLTPQQASVRPVAETVKATINSVALRWTVPTAGIDGYEIEIRSRANWINHTGRTMNLNNQILATITLGLDPHGTIYVKNIETHNLGKHEVKTGAGRGSYDIINPLLAGGTIEDANTRLKENIQIAEDVFGTQNVHTAFLQIGGLMAGTAYTFQFYTTSRINAESGSNEPDRFQNSQQRDVFTRVNASTQRYAAPLASVKNTGSGNNLVRSTHIEMTTPRPPQIPTKRIGGVVVPNENTTNYKAIAGTEFSRGTNEAFWDAHTNFAVEIYAAGTSVANQVATNNLLLLGDDQKMPVWIGGRPVLYSKVTLPDSVSKWEFSHIIEGSREGAGAANYANLTDVQKRNTAAKTTFAPVLERGLGYIIVIRSVSECGQQSEVRRVTVRDNHGMWV